jgi:hypothetical protein
MRRSSLPILGGISLVVAVTLAACFGPAEQEPSDSTGSEGAALASTALDGNYASTASTECPWTSDLDSSCAPGVSEKSCGGGSGKCGVSGSLGCTCVQGSTTTFDAGFPL